MQAYHSRDPDDFHQFLDSLDRSCEFQRTQRLSSSISEQIQVVGKCRRFLGSSELSRKQGSSGEQGDLHEAARHHPAFRAREHGCELRQGAGVRAPPAHLQRVSAFTKHLQRINGVQRVPVIGKISNFFLQNFANF